MNLIFELDFLSISNWIFAGYTGSKNQVWNRQKINFKNQVQKSIFWTRDFKNQVQMDVCTYIWNFALCHAKLALDAHPATPHQLINQGRCWTSLQFTMICQKDFSAPGKCIHPAMGVIDTLVLSMLKKSFYKWGYYSKLTIYQEACCSLLFLCISILYLLVFSNYNP